MLKKSVFVRAIARCFAVSSAQAVAERIGSAGCIHQVVSPFTGILVIIRTIFARTFKPPSQAAIAASRQPRDNNITRLCALVPGLLPEFRPAGPDSQTLGTYCRRKVATYGNFRKINRKMKNRKQKNGCGGRI